MRGRQLAGYQYKIQWLCQPHELKKLINALGTRSFTKFDALDFYGKTIEQYSAMMQDHESLAKLKAKRWIEKIKKHEAFHCFEVRRY